MTRRNRQSKPIGPRQPRLEPRSAKGAQPTGSSPMTQSTKAVAKPFAPKDWLFAVALLVAVFLVYQPAWQGGFIWDDNEHVRAPNCAPGRAVPHLVRIWGPRSNIIRCCTARSGSSTSCGATPRSAITW